MKQILTLRDCVWYRRGLCQSYKKNCRTVHVEDCSYKRNYRKATLEGLRLCFQVEHDTKKAVGPIYPRARPNNPGGMDTCPYNLNRFFDISVEPMWPQSTYWNQVWQKIRQEKRRDLYFLATRK